MEKLLLTNGRVVTPDGIAWGHVLVEGPVIKAVFVEPSPPDGIDAARVDCAGKYIGPGFVDIHVHGGLGVDFAAADVGEIERGIRYHLENGTTGIVPACISMPFPEIDRSIDAVRQAMRRPLSTILGYHVEGVYLNKELRGGHLLDYVHAPDPREYRPLMEKHADVIRLWTLAPELDGSLELISACTAGGIATSVGHSNADYDTLMRAIDAGLTHSTHFACVMGNLQFKALGASTGKGFAPGVLETVLLDDRLSTEVIADGYHLHKGIIQLAVKCKGAGKVCIVTDAMMGVGRPDGEEYVIGGQPCVTEHRLAIIKDRPDIIASSVTPMIDMVRFVAGPCAIPLHDAWTMASLAPARVIRVDDRKGSVTAGKDADLLILDEALNIASVYVRGERAFGDVARHV